MAIVEHAAPPDGYDLRRAWRALSWAMLAVAILTAPALFVWQTSQGRDPVRAVIVTVLAVAATRGVMEVIARRFLPHPTLFGEESEAARTRDAMARRRWWTWRSVVRFVWIVAVIVTVIWLVRVAAGSNAGWADTLTGTWHGITGFWSNSQNRLLLLQLPLFLLFNVVILIGPLMAMGIGQIKAYEPGDASWGVQLDDVRGQQNAKEEIRRIVALWQSGERFERAGGKRERGILFLGAPGTGKTMLAKAIATGFNCPFVTIPGSGFAQTFIGMDAVIVRYLAWRARRLARKWGGQCIVFIDEIDAVGMRRSSLGQPQGSGLHTPPASGFHGLDGALNDSGDLICESPAWREHVFTARGGGRAERRPSVMNYIMPGGMGMGGGGLALNQLLVVMDGMGEPPATRKLLVNKTNTILDALWVIPQRIGKVRLRLRPAKARTEQIYFIGACNVPIDALDPALTRPGRMGRHVFFRTPTKIDRNDIFGLYLAKVDHEPDLDTARRRDELARITLGYSPAMIEQVCSMALTIAHHDGRRRFGWGDLIESMTTIEAGTATGVQYVPIESMQTAVHEAGHAIAAHVYYRNAESTKLSIKHRTGSYGRHTITYREERFFEFQSEMIGKMIWGLGAMAAELVHYGETTNGVAGDLRGVTADAREMVGYVGMAPRLTLGPAGPVGEADYRKPLGFGFARHDAPETRSPFRPPDKRYDDRFEEIGRILLSVADGAVPGEKSKLAAITVGQAFMVTYHLMLANQDKLAQLATVLDERQELFGDELLEILDSLDLQVPEIDYAKESSWPAL
mgnify:CR=1 FL=1